jgi:hypothetical protein
MATGSHLTDRLAGMLPPWLAWPASALSTLLGFAGAGLIGWAATYGNIAAAVWSGVCFVLAAVLWHLAEFAGDGS